LSCKKRGFKNGNKRRKCEGLKQSRTAEERRKKGLEKPKTRL